MKAGPIAASRNQRMTFAAVNSAPLSERTNAGLPYSRISRDRVRTTSCARRLAPTSMARHSRVYSSITHSSFRLRPSTIWSCTKRSSTRRWAEPHRGGGCRCRCADAADAGAGCSDPANATGAGPGPPPRRAKRPSAGSRTAALAATPPAAARPGPGPQPAGEARRSALLQIFSVTFFKKIPLQQVFEENSDGNASCQLNLFEI